MRELPPKGPLRDRYSKVRGELLALRESSVAANGNVSGQIAGQLVVAHWARGWCVEPEGSWVRCCRCVASDLMEEVEG